MWTAGFQTEGRSSAKEPRQSGNVLYAVVKQNGSLLAGEHWEVGMSFMKKTGFKQCNVAYYSIKDTKEPKLCWKLLLFHDLMSITLTKQKLIEDSHKYGSSGDLYYNSS